MRTLTLKQDRALLAIAQREGEHKRVRKIHEEVRELSDALQAHHDAEGSWDDVIDELADVTLTIHIFRMAFPKHAQDIDSRLKFKADRTIEREGA